MANIIDGKAYAAGLLGRIKVVTEQLKGEYDLVPGLAVVLVGEDPASQVYVRNKSKQAVVAGFNSFHHKLSADVSESALLSLIDDLNDSDEVHGILVQLPLPEHIAEKQVINRIDPEKDVDGFHISNVGKLAVGAQGFVPCTPLGCIMLLKDHLGELSGLNAVVVGRSNIVGKPMVALLLNENCTVTVAHSRTQNLPEVCRSADILIAAVGRPQLIRGGWIKPGATVIDVGINRVDAGEGKTRLVGDVDFDTAEPVAGAITPVPGGVGPMTIACLLYNTLVAACQRRQVALPELDLGR